MKTRVAEVYRPVLLPMMTTAALVIFGNVGHAFPGSGANCAQCHTTAGGSVDVSQDPLPLLAGQSGQVILDVTELPANSAALSVTGLDNADLAAMVLNGWTDRGGGRYTLAISATGPQVLELGLPETSVAGQYELGVFLAGSGGWSTSTNFLLTAIPEPTSIALLSVIGATLGIGWITRRRKKARG